MARRLGRLAVLAVVVIGLPYFGYVGFAGSERLVHPNRSIWCFTPETEYGWQYEAINYDPADDARLAAEEDDLRDCRARRPPPGDEVVTPDGERIAGWYIPAADGMPPDGPTVVLVHGIGSSMSAMLTRGALLHDRYNLLLLDMRNHGRSTGTHSTMGVREQVDLKAMLDWAEAEKGATRFLLLGSSMGGVTSANVAADDPRVAALVLDSTHATLQNTVETRLLAAGHPVGGAGYLAVWIGAWIRTGENLAGADAVHNVGRLGDRPLLILQGGRDADQGPENAEQLLAAAQAGGVEVELHTCPEGRHAALLESCPDDYRTWLVDFVDRVFGSAAGTP
ncbi:MAG TPA: alpha/beta fold hydrolase [Candidatus Limnocylindria bacterium]|nr:alpha/beta fold hydrolase [Candidatus Limnocylindria bacterium]